MNVHVGRPFTKWQRDKAAPGAWYEALYSILGTTVTLFPILGLDGSAGASALATATTYTTLKATSSGQEAVVTNRVTAAATALASWATPPGLQGVCPIVTFNGTTNNMDTPDIAYFTRAGAAWSVSLWVKPRVVNVAMSFLSKYEGAGANEWDLFMNASGQAGITVFDDSATASIGRLYSVTLTAGAWQHLVFVDAGTNASTGLDIYLDGAVVDNTDNNGGVFVAMEDLAGLVRVGCRMSGGAREQFFDGAMAGGPCGPAFVQSAVTAAQAKRLFQMGRVALELT